MKVFVSGSILQLGTIGVMTDPSRGGGEGMQPRKSQHIFGYLSCIHRGGKNTLAFVFRVELHEMLTIVGKIHKRLMISQRY